MKPTFIKVLEKKTEWDVPIEKYLYLKLREDYLNSSPQEKGLIVEVCATALFSRIFGKGSWVGTERVNEFYDLGLGECRIDIKSTELNRYDLSASERQISFSKFYQEKIYFLLTSIKGWRDADSAIILQFHETAILSNGTLNREVRFKNGNKTFSLINRE